MFLEVTHMVYSFYFDDAGYLTYLDSYYSWQLYNMTYPAFLTLNLILLSAPSKASLLCDIDKVLIQYSLSDEKDRICFILHSFFCELFKKVLNNICQDIKNCNTN